MGNDGGSIPTRGELVRTRSPPPRMDPVLQLVALWYYCALSAERLRAPVVACELGRLYNKDAVIKHLIERNMGEGSSSSSSSSSSSRGATEHIRRPKDVTDSA